MVGLETGRPNGFCAAALAGGTPGDFGGHATASGAAIRDMELTIPARMG
jgi:hypothetical protein